MPWGPDPPMVRRPSITHSVSRSRGGMRSLSDSMGAWSAHAPDIALQILCVGVPHAAEVRVGAGAEAGVLLQGPIFQIVPGGAARLCEVGDLILLIALRPSETPPCTGTCPPGRRPPADRRSPAGQRGAYPPLPSAHSSSDAPAFRVHGSGKVFLPPLQRLVGQAVNQVQGQILNLGLPGGLHGGCPTCSMVWTRPMVRELLVIRRTAFPGRCG